MKIAGGCGPLRKLTILFNLPTDAKIWKKVNRWRREQTKISRSQIYELEGIEERMRECQVAFRSDLIEIKCVNMTFKYEMSTVPLFHNVDIKVPQGKIVAVVGEHGVGRTTFLRILGHQLFPDEGHVLIPTYLRILHISKDPVLLDFSIVQNLTFVDPSAHTDLVKNILQELQTKQIIDMASDDLKHRDDADHGTAISDGSSAIGEEELQANDWGKRLNSVEIAKLHLARALIVNPEVMIMQRPLIHFDDKEASRMEQVIRRHIRNRGLCLAEESIERRRPRTYFATPTTKAEVQAADIIWEVKGKVVTQISREKFDENPTDNLQ